MRHTLGQRFTFAVLDDVLMSVDVGHRREVCSLLKQHFSSTQFVITTHDDIWLQHMRTEKIVSSKSFVHFKRWSVDDGPVIWEGNEVWSQIQAELADSGVSTAAGTLRRYLEYISAQLAHKLQAEVPFRGDARWELGELLNHLRCSTCDTCFHVLPLRGSGAEVLRCDCGKYSFNVKKKSN